MRKVLMMVILTSVFSVPTFAVNLSEIQHVEGETQIVKLKGKFATVSRGNRTGDDKEEIKRCGKNYSVLLLDEPIRVSLTSMESGEKYEVVIQHLRTWGKLDVKDLGGETVEVAGVIGEELMGLCSPGLSIQQSSFYPNAK